MGLCLYMCILHCNFIIHDRVKRVFLSSKNCLSLRFQMNKLTYHRETFFYVVPSSEKTSFGPPSVVYISVILTHILHITTHAGPSVWAAIH